MSKCFLIYAYIYWKRQLEVSSNCRIRIVSVTSEVQIMSVRVLECLTVIGTHTVIIIKANQFDSIQLMPWA